MALFATGCAGNKAESSAIESYRAGDYSAALTKAKAASQNAEGPSKERANLVAGLSEYALRRPDEASTYLLPLLESQTPEISGTAGWTLGSIAYDRANYPKAISLLDVAAPKLKPDDAAKALTLKGDCYAKLGRMDDARQQYAAAAEKATDDTVKAQLQAKSAGGNVTGPTVFANNYPVTTSVAVPPGTRYVIQLGAFGDRAKAEKLASSCAGDVTRAGITRPRVEQRTDKSTGQTVFAVRAGDYPSRAAAEAAFARIAATGGKVGGTVMANLP